MKKTKVLSALLALTLSTTSLTIMPMTAYSRDYLTEAGRDGKPVTEILNDEKTELWDKFLKYDLCITDYDSLTEEEQELCHFIFDTEYSYNSAIVCERARRILAHDENIGERITLDRLKESCGIRDKYNDYLYIAYSLGTLEYIHCVPDIIYLDEDIGDSALSCEYWLDDNGTAKVLGKIDLKNKDYTVIEKDGEDPYNITVKESQYFSIVNKDGLWIKSYNFENAIEVNDDYYYITSQGTAVLFKSNYSNDDWNYANPPEAITEPHIIPSEIDGHKVTAIDACAFASSPYTEIVLPDSIEYIGPRAFIGSKYLEKVNFPKGLKTIADSAFGATSLKELNIDCPELVIKYMAFGGINCEEIYVNAKEIDNYTFMVCMDLKKVRLGNNVEKIGYNAFGECNKLEEINIPSSVRTIGQSAFLSCTSLKSVTVPDSVKVIGTLTYKRGRPISDLGYDPVIPLYQKPECAFYSDCKIKGRAGSEIESYAKEWGLDFTALYDDMQTVIGDANCNGELNMGDAVIIMQALANPDKYGENGTDEHHITEQGKKNADIAGDNDGITNADALAIQMKLLGLN